MGTLMAYRLLDRFAQTFSGGAYLHRNPNLGNRIADCLYEDLYELTDHSEFRQRVDSGNWVLNPKNVSPGVRARRGDGSFGAAVPGSVASKLTGFAVPRGPTATTEIGCEVKIVAKAMGKQIDRVVGDLRRQADQFRRKNERAITVAAVGVNFAPSYVSFEGERTYPTDGVRHRHPGQEARDVLSRLHADVEDAYDELVVLEFEATNQAPYPFRWMNKARTEATYGSALVRILGLYRARHPA